MRDSQKPWEIVRHMQQLLATGRDSERQPAKMKDSERYVATPLDRTDSERQLEILGDSEIYAATPFN